MEDRRIDFVVATFLYALAGLMITFAGFSTLLLSLRPAAGVRLSLLDRYLAKTVMTYIFVLTAGASDGGDDGGQGDFGKEVCCASER